MIQYSMTTEVACFPGDRWLRYMLAATVKSLNGIPHVPHARHETKRTTKDRFLSGTGPSRRSLVGEGQATMRTMAIVVVVVTGNAVATICRK